jgi:hypothetical protein
MTPSIKAILNRFNGDQVEAIHYCAEIARNYPDLRDEYFGNLDAIRNLNVESQMEMDRRL